MRELTAILGLLAIVIGFLVVGPDFSLEDPVPLSTPAQNQAAPYWVYTDAVPGDSMDMARPWGYVSVDPQRVYAGLVPSGA